MTSKKHLPTDAQAEAVSNFEFHGTARPAHYCILNTSEDSFLFDCRLSPTTVRVMTMICTLQSRKWVFSAEGLAALMHCGVRLIRGALAQLRKYGYYAAVPVREGGRFAGVNHYFYDVARPELAKDDASPSCALPSAAEPSAVRPSAVRPSAVRSTQLNNNNTFYRNKPKTHIPNAPARVSSLVFDLDEICERPPKKDDTQSSG